MNFKFSKIIMSAIVISILGASSSKATTVPTLTPDYTPHTVLEANMISDVYSVETGVYSALYLWRNVPPSLTTLTSDKGAWRIINNKMTIQSGKLKSSQDKVSGTIWIDGQSCIQVSNPKVKYSFSLRSDKGNVVKGVCPTKDILGQ